MVIYTSKTNFIIVFSDLDYPPGGSWRRVRHVYGSPSTVADVFGLKFRAADVFGTFRLAMHGCRRARHVYGSPCRVADVFGTSVASPGTVVDVFGCRAPTQSGTDGQCDGVTQ
ncbi:unnamed protein product [Heligmosomoides polygyrus]|uniref:Lipase domain-containing protein n=1 Tax=Heligmosomoides polygyrus TaxID=6339 RepID=A0A183G242_HELPZ|nr:unnamed protein product [Heligmosomoides polygyrus]